MKIIWLAQKFSILCAVAVLAACGDSDNASAASETATVGERVKADQANSGQASVAPPTDYLSFAQGAVPVMIGGGAELLNVGMEQALRTIDGDRSSFSATPKSGGDDSEIWFIYRLPAATTFTQFSVPNVLETPSPGQTFFREIEVSGGNDGPDGAFDVLGTAELTTHAKAGQLTEFVSASEAPVSWVKVKLSGGINIERDQTFFEFSEIIGQGRQEPVQMSTAFNGKWRGRGVILELKQNGSSVSGCYDRVGDLRGSVNGGLLHATGTNRTSGVKSAFILAVVDGNVTGVRSTNGAPFKLYRGNSSPDLVTECSSEPVTQPGCGDTLYGIRFDYDSAIILPKSDATLDSLRSGLSEAPGSAIEIVGHTSSEGDDAYNQDLSQRRAEAVVAALAKRGISAGSLSARGAGETQPIADNSSETGRSLNRRVEVVCQ